MNRMELRLYLDQNFRTDIPDWLANFNPENRDEYSNLIQHFLCSRIVYYPGSGLDGSAVKFFNEGGAAHCFLYVDYLMTQDALETALRDHGFRGYSSIARLHIRESDMGASGWKPNLRPEEVQYRFQPVPPYAFLEILEKSDDAVAGAPRLAILFLAADGHAAYDALFCQKDSVAAPFAIIAQDHGFGGNWSAFGAGGAMETISQRAGVFPNLMLVGDNTQAWAGFARVENVDPVPVTGGQTRILYSRDFND
jgi:hypothetical protein